MDKNQLSRRLTTLVEQDIRNRVSAEDAIYPELAGLQLFEAPILGYASADDPLFDEYRSPKIVHPQHKTPRDWLPDAKTVISFFMPFTQRVKRSNLLLKDPSYETGANPQCSAEWLHGRSEGDLFINLAAETIAEALRQEGWQAVAPTASGGVKLILPYVSNWSERHVAYAAGLGTFSLTRGLITEKGMAGRFGSVVTNAVFEPTVRQYSTPFEYCTLCGACMKRCPMGAIDKARGYVEGKDQNVCGPYVRGGRMPAHGPHNRIRHGCGKCQVGVPCQDGIPVRP